ARTTSSAPPAASHSAWRLTEASSSARRARSWSTAVTKPPISRRSHASSNGCEAVGSVGRNPGGPASVARTPRARMSSRTRSAASCRPQSGASQTPHEIGAPASFICVKEIRSLESRRVKIAILGVGRLGAFHAKVLRDLKGVDELRINDADAERAAALAKELGAKHATSIDDALAGADAVVIVTPTGTHAELISRALDKGLAVFCEKPIALDLESTKRVVDHVDRTKGRVQIGFQRRFDAGYQEARRRLREGGLGTVYSFHMTSRDALPPPDAYIETSGGQFVDQLIHDFDVTRWMFGDEVEELYATGSTLGFPQYGKWGDVATSAVVLRLRGGAVGALEAARHNEAG